MTLLVDPRSAAVADLRARVSGEVIERGDAGYDEARAIHSASFDRRPAAIVKAADPGDVAAAIAFAREHELPLAVRAGGHSLAGHSTVDDGVVVDLRGLDAVEIDAERRLGRAGGGVTAGAYTAAAGELGLATPFGDTGTVGLGGLTLGGGVGFLARSHGLTIDSLVSADVVTADGRLVTASADENPDLFWAIRGGGGNFGVVTSFQYRLHEVGMVYGGALVQPATRNLLRGFVPVAATAPDALTTISMVMAAPPMPFIPADRVGELVLATLAVHSGPVSEGDAAFAPLRSLARPIADTLGPIPYPAIYGYTAQGGAPSAGEAIRSVFLESMEDHVVDTILGFMRRATSPAAMVQIRVLGGAMARVGAGETAFAHRGQRVLIAIIAPFVGPVSADEHVAWTEDFYAALRPHATGVYSNFLGDEGEARVRAAYPVATYRRLAEVKRAWDPDNVFRRNQNIRPA